MSRAPYLSERGREFRFNDYVVAEMMMGVPDEKRTGRLVQVRKGTGPFHTDSYLVRLRDGSLMHFANVMLRHASDERFVEAFYLSNGMTPPTTPEQEPWEGDTEQTEYTLSGGQFPETGFVIEKPSEPDHPQQSFTMRVTKKEGRSHV